ncbi:MAG: trimethylamine methyltransferase family protein, partial [Armatimonadetes bacterium]|nr:trimethylamine methyltransferase family protein [Armatimonadota bacterium]
FSPDARAGYESMITAFAAWSAGAHVGLQACGILDQINAMCYEKFVLDLEVWGYVKRVATPAGVDADSLAMEVIAACPGDYLTAEHTMKHFREELLTPSLAPPLSYDAWLAQGRPDALTLAGERVARLQSEQEAT